jgi:hypothetical protein
MVTQERRVLQRSARAHQIRGDDGLAVPGRECMRRAQRKRNTNGHHNHPRRERLLVQQSREGLGLRRAALQ